MTTTVEHPYMHDQNSHRAPGYRDSDQLSGVHGQLEQVHELLGRTGIHDPEVSDALQLLERAAVRSYDVVRETATGIVERDGSDLRTREEQRRSAGNREFQVPTRSVKRVQNALLAMYGLKPETRDSNVAVARALDDIGSTITGVIRGQSNRFGESADVHAQLIGYDFDVSPNNGFSDEDISALAPELDNEVEGVLSRLVETLDATKEDARTRKTQHVGHKALSAFGLSAKKSRRDQELEAIGAATDELIALYKDGEEGQVDHIARELLLHNGYEAFAEDQSRLLGEVTSEFHARMESSYMVVKAAKQIAEVRELAPRFTQLEDVLIANGGEPQRLGLDTLDEGKLETLLDKYDEIRAKSSNQKQALQRLNRAYHSDISDGGETFRLLTAIFPNNKPALVTDN